ncbi:hypothetical protein ONS95_007160 [Cadophora gregata]|uniref:uncharacterized protein n=1 Tax=Cadophora gregata TaxID=51156 RepID=UPI0026DD9009|nr:uncharacterized protein ONS95_007160 [Cadophora gregata]KAK0100709.1 hypothetical protein ONS95_007160 [Cadophora gregata]KAK0117294.1 hypothetical protein ONS96_013127 [Cadophora gregata f. sp. sojae]
MIVTFATPTAPKAVIISVEEIKLQDGRRADRAKASYAKPALLDVDKNSRRVVLKMFTAAFTINLQGGPVYFNFKTDALVYDCRRSMQIFNGFDLWDWYGLEPPCDVSPNQHPILMIGFIHPGYYWLSPQLLNMMGRPAYVTFLHKSGVDFRNSEHKLSETYKLPKISFKTPLQMLKWLDEIKNTTTEEETRRIKEIEAIRDIRVVD